MRLSKHQTNELIALLEVRAYRRRLSSMQLAQKADVPLDMVNRVNEHLRIADAGVVERIAKALGISGTLLCQIAGLQEISPEDYQILMQCVEPNRLDSALPPECARIGLKPVESRPEEAA